MPAYQLSPWRKPTNCVCRAHDGAKRYTDFCPNCIANQESKSRRATTAPKMMSLNVWPFAGSGMGIVPKRPTGFMVGASRNVLEVAVMACKFTRSADTLTRQFPYNSDKLSRLAPPFKLIERRPPCGTKSLAKGGRLAPVLRAEGGVT